MIDRLVVRDLEEPTAEVCYSTQLRELIERLRENVLNDVLALDRGAHHSRAVPVEVGAHLADQLVECLSCGCLYFGFHNLSRADDVSTLEDGRTYEKDLDAAPTYSSHLDPHPFTGPVRRWR